MKHSFSRGMSLLLTLVIIMGLSCLPALAKDPEYEVLDTYFDVGDITLDPTQIHRFNQVFYRGKQEVTIVNHTDKDMYMYNGVPKETTYESESVLAHRLHFGANGPAGTGSNVIVEANSSTTLNL